ncbi:hypothetical protein [Streptomyces sp. NPDC060366]|uniref:hypothetical protein n=1 Tax=Streptomyces sp. NPDC060366 TaxID=3347105 RepID=UPI0036535A0B
MFKSPQAESGLSVAAVAAGNFALNVWNGAPYPSTDPDTVAQRLKDRSDEVYDCFALPGKYPAESGRSPPAPATTGG